MMPAVLTLELVPTTNQRYELRLELDDDDQRQRPPQTFPCGPFDAVELRTLLSSDPDAYGAKLSQALFADPQAVAKYREWRTAALNRNNSCAVPVQLIVPTALQGLRWELLHDPASGQPVGCDDKVWWSRLLPVHDPIPSLPALASVRRVLLAVADPVDATTYGLPAIDAAYTDQLRRALADWEPTVISASLDDLRKQLYAGYDVLVLVAHGRLVEGQPWLFLVNEQQRVARQSGNDLVTMLKSLGERCPRLVVLISCAGAGDDDRQPFTALGPLLAQSGPPVVIAAYGNLSLETAEHSLPTLFRDLRLYGQIDRALNAARLAAKQHNRSDWWALTLFSRLRDCRLWVSAPAHQSDSAPFTVPYHRNLLFRGRDKELDDLKRWLCSDEQVTVVINGMAGLGKSQLVSECAHRLRDHFPGGVFWLSMTSAEDIKVQVANCGGLNGLNLPGWDGLKLDDQVAAVKQAWAMPVRRLLIFDNLEDRELLAQWRPNTGGAQVLVTSRRGDWRATDGLTELPLRPLDRSASYQVLLGPRAYEQGRQQAYEQARQIEEWLADVQQRAAADAICDELGDLPLALALAGAYLAGNPRLVLADYHRRLQELLLADPALTDAMAADAGLPTKYQRGVAAALTLSYAQLTPEKDAAALSLFHRLAWLASLPVPEALLTALSNGQSPDPALRRLRAVGLIDRREVQLHRLVAAFGRERDPEPAVTLTATVTAMLKVIDEQELDRMPLVGIPYRPHLEGLSRHADQLAETLAVRLLTTTGWLLKVQGAYAAARPLYERALAIRERTLGPDHPDTRIIRNNLTNLNTE